MIMPEGKTLDFSATFVLSAIMCEGRTLATGSMALVMQGHVSDVPGAVAQIAMLSIAI